MFPDDVIRLRHMAEAAESALRFCQGRTRADLDTDDMLRFALTRAVEIIGEAANIYSHLFGDRPRFISTEQAWQLR
jgi:uncharacterized protein with HEPN domain